MFDTKYDIDKAIELLTRAVEERGADYVYHEPPILKEDGTQLVVDGEPQVYSECRYADDTGAPSCIVGYVANYLDFLSEMESEEGEGIGASDAFALRFTDEAIEVLAVAQREQDNRHPWGKALSEARVAAEV